MKTFEGTWIEVALGRCSIRTCRGAISRVRFLPGSGAAAWHEARAPRHESLTLAILVRAHLDHCLKRGVSTIFLLHDLGEPRARRLVDPATWSIFPGEGATMLRLNA